MQTAVITGCSSGFGLNIAVTLARNGFRVFATMRNLDKRATLDKALADAGVKAEILALDVNDQASIDTAIAMIIAAAGRIDALVNNAGFGIGGFIEDMSLEEFRRQMDTNFFGLVAVTKAVLPHMRKQRTGRIVNISSIGGRAGNPIVAAYVASKFAVEGFSEALAFEASLFGVNVVLVEPGAFKTEIMDSNRQVAAGMRDPNSPYAELSRATETKIDAMMTRMAGDPQKVADVVLHVLTTAKPRLRYLVGTDAKLMGTIHRLFGFEAYVALVRRFIGWSELREKFLSTQSKA
jgi:NAD(P)-dependent dehydrogenase (short-subunit alcohol dehydrogenase family)